MTEEEMAALAALMKGGDEKAGVATFTASFDSECDTCGGGIYEGEQAGYIGDTDRPSCQECISE